MKLAIVRGGGLAGLLTTTRLHSEALPPQEAEKFESRVRSAAQRSAPASASKQSHPDGLLYELTIGEQGEERTLRFTDENLPDDVRSLIEWVDSRPERELERSA